MHSNKYVGCPENMVTNEKVITRKIYIPEKGTITVGWTSDAERAIGFPLEILNHQEAQIMHQTELLAGMCESLAASQIVVTFYKTMKILDRFKFLFGKL